MARRLITLVLAGVLAAAGTAAAQAPPPGSAGVGEQQQTAPPPQAPQPTPGGRGQRPGGPGPVNPNVALRDVQGMLNSMALVDAQAFLHLSDPQWVAFVPKMRELQKVRMQHQERRRQLIQQIRRATVDGSTLDEAALAANVKDLDDLEAKMATDERAALSGVDSVLTVYQRARFRVFEETIELRKLELLAKVMNSPGGAPAPTPAPDAKGAKGIGRGGHLR
jgi:hypothetical protein